MASEGAWGSVSSEERLERYVGLTATGAPWRLDWGKIIILLAILQFLLSAMLDRNYEGKQL
jgi:hypothetical protein